MIDAKPNHRYEIELCSGERRRWTCLGPDLRAVVWWRDDESGREFSETSLMYAWKIVARHEDPTDEENGSRQ